MEYHIRIEEEVAPAIRRIALKQIEVGIQEIEDTTLDRHEVVHQIRKRCKKQRALASLDSFMHRKHFPTRERFLPRPVTDVIVTPRRPSTARIVRRHG